MKQELKIFGAMIAVFLVLRLRNVLGRRDGHDGGKGDSDKANGFLNLRVVNEVHRFHIDYMDRFSKEWMMSTPAIKRPRLSVAMIVRDAQQCLEQTIQSVADIAEEMVVVDTGSVDKTVECAAAAGATS